MTTTDRCACPNAGTVLAIQTPAPAATLYLATCDRQPYSLGRSPEEAHARAEARLRAACADMERLTGAVADGIVDLADLDAEVYPLAWPVDFIRAALGATWGGLDEDLVALGLVAA